MKDALILDGKVVRDKIAARLRAALARHKKAPCLAIIQVGDVRESSAYIHQKKLFAQRIGAKVLHLHFDPIVSEALLVRKITALNKDKSIQGIIVQLPLPKHISVDAVIESIDPRKDVDGLTAVNVKKLMKGDKTGILPGTARGVMALCKAYDISLEGKNVTIIGRSALVGHPIAELFQTANATVTICHHKTKNLAEHTRTADIIVVAVGHPNLISAKHVQKGQIVIDVGITAIMKKNKRTLRGDVNFDSVFPLVSALSPVPGGVGPLTVACLFENLCEVIE